MGRHPRSGAGDDLNHVWSISDNAVGVLTRLGQDISDEARVAQRYTLSHLAHDLRTQTGSIEPMPTKISVNVPTSSAAPRR